MEARRSLNLAKIYGMSLRVHNPGFESPGCNSVLDAFLENVNRALCVLEPAMFTGYTAHVKEQFRQEWFIEKFKTPTPDLAELEAAQPEFYRRLGAIMEATTEKRVREITGTIAGSLDLFVDRAPPEIGVAFEQLYKSMVIQSWTSVEVMVGDLWESALNEHPESLAHLSNDEGARKAGDADKAIPLSILSRNNFDLSKTMGTILRDKFNFQKMESIQSAYKAAFTKHGKNVIDAISHESLKALSLVRNIIVHKSGVIDDMFYNASESISSLKSIRAQGIGRRIFLDAEDIIAIVIPAITQCFELLDAVDKWLKDHPRK